MTSGPNQARADRSRTVSGTVPNAMAPSPPRRPRRRWLRFSLRTLLLLTTVFGVWLGVKVNQARRQKETVDSLRALGVYVNYAHWRRTDDPQSFDSSQELGVPTWLRNLAGDDFFQRVVAVRILPPSTDDDLIHFAALSHLEDLYLGGRDNHISDRGLANLPRPDRLSISWRAARWLATSS